MNHDTALKLQAWLDGELPPAGAAEAARLVERDQAAQVLVSELKETRVLLVGNELERKLLESREFYWSKIERGMARVQMDQSGASRPIWLAWWFRFLAPVAIAAALAVLLLTPVLRPGHPLRSISHAEIESPLDDISSFTFSSDSEGMTVVWVSTQ